MDTIPNNYWQIIEENIPNYSTRKDVLENNLMLHFVDGGHVSKKDIKLLNLYDKIEVKKRLHESNLKLYQEALLNKK